MVNFLQILVDGIKRRLADRVKDNPDFERDFETYSPTGVPRNLLRYAGLERKYHPADARKKDKEPLRKVDYKYAPINRIGDSQIFHFDDYSLEEEEQ